MDRSHNSKWAWATLLIGGPILITAFQNCGQLFEDPVINFDQATLASTGNLQVAGACERQIMTQYDALYRATYYPYLTSSQNCAACHSGSGPGIGAFAYPDVTVSGNNFISRFSRINQNARNIAHATGFTGTADDLAAINSFEPQWAQAVMAYQECTNQAIAGMGVMTGSKGSAQIITNANNNNANYVTLTWNLDQEVVDQTLRGRIPLTLSIEVRVARIGGVRRGYEFRNPSVRLNTGATSSFRLSTLKVYINNSYMSDVTTYSFVDAVVNSTTATNLAPGAAVALAVTTAEPINTDVFGIEIGSVRDEMGTVINPGNPNPPTPPVTPPVTPAPTTVTLAQLLGNDTNLNVFAASCVSCHNSTTTLGGLNLTNATQARTNAAEIMSRMNNAGNPMPPNGVLPQGRRDLVNIWIQSGAN